MRKYTKKRIMKRRRKSIRRRSSRKMRIYRPLKADGYYKEKITVVLDWLNMSFPNTKPNRTAGYCFFWYPTASLE